MTDNNQDRSQDEGQQGIDRETEQRNRENETGQQQDQQFGQQGQSDTNLADNDQTGGQSSTGQGPSGEGGFVGSGQDNSSDYVTKGEENQDFAPEGQGAQETNQGSSDVETGQSQESGSEIDDGSDTNR